MDDLHPIAGRFRALAELAAEERQSGVVLEAVPYMAHEQFESEQPRFREAAVAEEMAALRSFQLAHGGSGEGYVPRREFPCPGMLVVEDQDAAIWMLECDRCGFQVSVPLRVAAPERMVEHRLERSRVPSQFLEREFEPIAENESALAIVRGWLADFPKGRLPAPCVYGEPGRGKTHLLAMVARDLITRYGVDVLYRSAIDMFDELQAGFDDDSFEVKWERLCTVPVLLLDDLGSERRTEFRDERLAQLIDLRYRSSESADPVAQRPIVVATNVRPERWSEKFGERPASRLRGMLVRAQMGGPDRRAGMGVQQEMLA